MACICALMRAPGEARRAGLPERGARGGAAGEGTGLCWPRYGRGGGASTGVRRPRLPRPRRVTELECGGSGGEAPGSLSRWDDAGRVGRAFQMKRGVGRQEDPPHPLPRAATGKQRPRKRIALTCIPQHRSKTRAQGTPFPEGPSQGPQCQPL